MQRSAVATLPRMTASSVGSPSREQSEKNAILRELRGSIGPRSLEQAFVLPSREEALIAMERAGTHPLCARWCALKRRALRSLVSVKDLQKLSAADSNEKNTNLAALLLLEALFFVRTGKLKIADRRTFSHLWMSLADRYGLWRFRYALEDALFSLDDPETFGHIMALLQEQEELHSDLFQQILSILRHHLAKADLDHVEVLYRRKNVFGVHQKMVMRSRSFSRITDLFGFRIISESPEECYRAIDVVHWLWRPYPERFKDYIASPKPNGYRSIHTTVQCLQGVAVEFQVRTREMDRVALVGSACYAHYKSLKRQALFPRGD